MNTGLLFFLIVVAVLIFLVNMLVHVRRNARPSKPNAAKLILKGKVARGQAMLRLLADKGDAEAEYLHGMTALQVDDIKTFFDSMGRAAEWGYSPAALASSKNYIAGEGVAQDFARAEKLLLPLVEEGDKDALMLLLKVYAMSDNRAGFGKLMAKTRVEDNQAAFEKVMGRERTDQAISVQNTRNTLAEVMARIAAAAEVWKEAMRFQIPGEDKRPEAVRNEQKRAVEKAIDRIHETLVAGYSHAGKVDYRAALNAAGALAGLGCQVGIRDGVVASGKVAAEGFCRSHHRFRREVFSRGCAEPGAV